MAAGTLTVPTTRVVADVVVTGEPKTRAGCRIVALDRDTHSAHSERALHDFVSSRCLAEPFGAELGDPFQAVEVDVDQPEAVAMSCDPLEVVLRAPKEVA